MQDLWKWPELGWRAWLLTMDATAVVSLRLMLMASGGARSHREAQRMVGEKLRANAAFASELAQGRAGVTPATIADRALSFYGPKVRANRRRLSRAQCGSAKR